MYSVNHDVDRINKERLAQLKGEVKEYQAHDNGPAALLDKLQGMTMYPKYLELKVGAQVILLKNRDGLVNGSRGVVVKFEKNDIPVVKFVNGRQESVERDTFEQEVNGQKVSRDQLPLKLAWAITIHKSQAELKGSIGEGPNHSNDSNRSNSFKTGIFSLIFH